MRRQIGRAVIEYTDAEGDHVFLQVAWADRSGSGYKTATASDLKLAGFVRSRAYEYKRAYFAITCVFASAAATMISGQWLTGFLVGFGFYWLLMSADAIASPSPEPPPNRSVTHADCDL